MNKIKISQSQRYTFAILLLVVFGVIFGFNRLSNNQETKETLAKKSGETKIVTEPILTPLNYSTPTASTITMIPLLPTAEPSKGGC